MTGGRAALDYAEREIGVHSVHDEARRLSLELDNHRKMLVTAKKDRLRTEEAMADREIELATDLRAEMPEASLAAFERQLKTVVHKDARMRGFRGMLFDANHNISHLEVEVSRTRVDIDIAVARMTELGGYFQYLAAVKQAETANKAPLVPPENWPPG